MCWGKNEKQHVLFYAFIFSFTFEYIYIYIYVYINIYTYTYIDRYEINKSSIQFKSISLGMFSSTCLSRPADNINKIQVRNSPEHFEQNGSTKNPCQGFLHGPVACWIVHPTAARGSPRLVYSFLTASSIFSFFRLKAAKTELVPGGYCWTPICISQRMLGTEILKHFVFWNYPKSKWNPNSKNVVKLVQASHRVLQKDWIRNRIPKAIGAVVEKPSWWLVTQGR